MAVNILVVIPARGGSKGIPRKNLRDLQGKPLLYYAIHTALASHYSPDVYVSSEDEEILTVAKHFGAKVHQRDLEIANDETTLDPVIYAAYRYAQTTEQKIYDLVITMQPTSPLLKVTSLDAAITRLLQTERIDTVIAAKDDTHLSWRYEDGRYLPNYTKRVNRQYLTPTFSETGAFLITRGRILSPENRIGKHVSLHLLKNGEEIDIDTYEDWNLCAYYLKRKHILFVVTGNAEVGLGHVYNTLLIANDILEHQVSFLVDSKSQMAYDKIKSKNYPVSIQTEEDIVQDIQKINPDMVINDRLDTDIPYMKALKALEVKVMNFEDLGEGASLADSVVNAIYPEKRIIPNHYFGHAYFLLRDEFLLAPLKKIQPRVSRVLITFGGVDPNNYTLKVLESIDTLCRQEGIAVTVITGFGYDKFHTLEKFTDVSVLRNIGNISEHMLAADLIFTSAGRTVYEVASLGVPTIVLAQNEREMTHFFASKAYGFLHLGLGYLLSKESILEHFKELVEGYESRIYMQELMQSVDLKSGRKRVKEMITMLLGDTQ